MVIKWALYSPQRSRNPQFVVSVPDASGRGLDRLIYQFLTLKTCGLHKWKTHLENLGDFPYVFHCGRYPLSDIHERFDRGGYEGDS